MNRCLTVGWAVRQGSFLLRFYELMSEDKACVKIMPEKIKLKDSINSVISIVRRVECR
jgi:hypothetical protein